MGRLEIAKGFSVLRAAALGWEDGAHRPATIQECDTFLVWEEGSRHAFGPGDQMLREMVKNHADSAGPAGRAAVAGQVTGPQIGCHSLSS